MKTYPRIIDRRTVSLMDVPGVVRLLGLRLEEILAGSWEPEATIGHLSMEEIDIGEARRSGMLWSRWHAEWWCSSGRKRSRSP